MTKFEHEFNIGQYIYHKMNESSKGLILDISYSIRYDEVKYRVSFGNGPNDELWCTEDELCEGPNFN